MKKISFVGSGMRVNGTPPKSRESKCDQVQISGEERAIETPIEIKCSELTIVVLLAESKDTREEFWNSAPRHCCLGRFTVDGSNGLAQTIFKAIGAGAPGAIEAPGGEFVARVAIALDRKDRPDTSTWGDDDASFRFGNLTPRQQEIMDLVLAGHPNKIIAADLGISQRTVENHRAAIMKKTGAKSLPALVRMAMMAGKLGHPALTSQH